MASETLTIRIQQSLKDDFARSLAPSGLSMSDKIKEWISEWLSEEEVQLETESFRGEQERFLEAHGLSDEKFNLDQERPAELLTSEMDFSWMFEGAERKDYLIATANYELSSENWYLDHWLWIVFWCWTAVAGDSVPFNSTSLLERWGHGHDPVETVLSLLVGKGHDERLKELLEKYIADDRDQW